MGMELWGRGSLRKWGSHSCKVLRSRNLGRILLEAVRGRCRALPGHRPVTQELCKLGVGGS